MPEAATSLEAAVQRNAEAALDKVAAARSAIATVIFGQEQVVEETLVTLLAGGHGLLVGVPGLAKTKLVETLGTVLGLDARRVQFTPDLMPADILGSEILEESVDHKRSFKFMKGPIFAQLLMADEINRASPRTQSALLQAMQEYHVSVAGERYDLPAPFHVLATQNPLEQEGHLPAARGATRSVPDAGRRHLSRSRGGAAHPDRDDRRGPGPRQAGDDQRGVADDPAPRAAPAGRRERRRGDPRHRPLGPSGRR